jgi:hypothetical protein
MVFTIPKNKEELILKGAKHTPFLSDCFYHTQKKKLHCSINNLGDFKGYKTHTLSVKCLLPHKEQERTLLHQKP